MLAGPVLGERELTVIAVDQGHAGPRRLLVAEAQLAREELRVDVHRVRRAGVQVVVVHRQLRGGQHRGDVARPRVGDDGDVLHLADAAGEQREDLLLLAGRSARLGGRAGGARAGATWRAYAAFLVGLSFMGTLVIRLQLRGWQRAVGLALMPCPSGGGRTTPATPAPRTPPGTPAGTPTGRRGASRATGRASAAARPAAATAVHAGSGASSSSSPRWNLPPPAAASRFRNSWSAARRVISASSCDTRNRTVSLPRTSCPSASRPCPSTTSWYSPGAPASTVMRSSSRSRRLPQLAGRADHLRVERRPLEVQPVLAADAGAEAEPAPGLHPPRVRLDPQFALRLLLMGQPQHQLPPEALVILVRPSAAAPTGKSCRRRRPPTGRRRPRPRPGCLRRRAERSSTSAAFLARPMRAAPPYSFKPSQTVSFSRGSSARRSR